jgi:hypothetical protein
MAAAIIQIDYHKTAGPWHWWGVTYDDGSTAEIEMLSPADGKDAIKVGDLKSSHNYAIKLAMAYDA